MNFASLLGGIVTLLAGLFIGCAAPANPPVVHPPVPAVLPAPSMPATSSQQFPQLTSSGPAGSSTAVNQSSGVEPDKLAVTRTQNNVNDQNAPPFARTITDRSVVEAIYATVRGVSSTPAPLPCNKDDLECVMRELRQCPADEGPIYTLDFYDGETLALRFQYDPTGCTAQPILSSELEEALSLTDNQFYEE
jgi:hypothetical protein